ncbi:MAG: hypothetical protein EXQ82_10175 [Pseudolabrys sp.]|nr:hypothetical protein [Pseudolabrys sp.]
MPDSQRNGKKAALANRSGVAARHRMGRHSCGYEKTAVVVGRLNRNRNRNWNFAAVRIPDRRGAFQISVAASLGGFG